MTELPRPSQPVIRARPCQEEVSRHLVPRSAWALPPGRWRFCYQPVGLQQRYMGRRVASELRAPSGRGPDAASQAGCGEQVPRQAIVRVSGCFCPCLPRSTPQASPALGNHGLLPKEKGTIQRKRRKREAPLNAAPGAKPRGLCQAEGALARPARGVCRLPGEHASTAKGGSPTSQRLAPQPGVHGAGIHGAGRPGRLRGRLSEGWCWSLTKVTPHFPRKFKFRGRAGACPIPHSLAASKKVLSSSFFLSVLPQIKILSVGGAGWQESCDQFPVLPGVNLTGSSVVVFLN